MGSRADSPCASFCTGFTSHHAVAQTVINVLLRLSDSLLLPFNVSDYSETLQSFLQTAQADLGSLLRQQSIDLGTVQGFLLVWYWAPRLCPLWPERCSLPPATGPLVSAVERFKRAAAALNQHIEILKKNLSE